MCILQEQLLCSQIHDASAVQLEMAVRAVEELNDSEIERDSQLGIEGRAARFGAKHSATDVSMPQVDIQLR